MAAMFPRGRLPLKPSPHWEAPSTPQGRTNLLEKPHLIPAKRFIPLLGENHPQGISFLPIVKLIEFPGGDIPYPNAKIPPKFLNASP